jgi:hypothetical protein
MVAVASSIAFIAAISKPIGRIIIRIIELQRSAVLAHMLAILAIWSPDAASAHMIEACSAAEQASIQSCIIFMSMPGMFMLIMSIVLVPIFIMVVSENYRMSPERRHLRLRLCYEMLRRRRGDRTPEGLVFER